jgi:3D (Asp-Asp-Asp) domain-containing protein
MSGGKRLAFALLVMFFAGANAAAAYTNTNNEQGKNEILVSQKDVYTLKNDPLLINLFLGNGKEEVKNSDVEKSSATKEEMMLDRWKRKQADRWTSLPKGKFVVNASAYTASADECGNDKGITASGLLVKKNQTLACPPEFPFGVKIAIEGVGTLRCEDRGGAIKGNHVDIYVETKTEAFAFGRRNLVAEVMFE